MLPAMIVFGLGLAITVAPLTATAMSSAPAEHSGIASAVNNDVARFGGLLAVAVLPALAGITGTAYLHPEALPAGFRTAALIAGAMCAADGLLAAFTITNPARAPACRRGRTRRVPPLRPRRAITHHRRQPGNRHGMTSRPAQDARPATAAPGRGSIGRNAGHAQCAFVGAVPSVARLWRCAAHRALSRPGRCS